MNYFLKQRVWLFIALFFMIVNVVLLCGMFMRKEHRGMKDHRHARMLGNEERPNRKDRRSGFYLTRMLTDSLGFTEEQRAKLQSINARMDLKKDSLIRESQNTRQLLFKEMYAADPNQQKLDSLINRVSSLTEAYNRQRVEHANIIRGMCNAEQKKRLPILFTEHQNKRNHQRTTNR